MIKKLILLLLVVCGGVVSANAGNYKVYIKKTAPDGTLIHVWGTNITQGETTWPGVLLSTLSIENIHGVDYYYYDIVADSYQFLLQTGADVNKTSDSDVLSTDCYVEYNGNGGSLNILSSTVVNSLCLPGSHNNWTAENSIFTNNNDDTYSYQLAATDWVQFKLLAFSNWVNYSDVTIDAPSGWTKENSTNIALENSAAKTGYKSFDLFATDLGNGSWNLRIRGNESYDFIIGGDPAIVNGTASFSATEELNLMTDDEKDGTFVLTVCNLQLTAGDYEYKVFRDKVTNGWQVPSTGNNTLTIATDGTYNITYTLVVNTYELSAEATPVPTSVSATLGNYGYTTFASSYPLNLDGINEGITAYYVANSPITTTVKLTKATGNIAAGEGIILYGQTPNAEVTIPVAASGFKISGNLLVGCPNDASLTKTTPGYENVYVLVNTDKQAEFQKVKEWLDKNNTLTIPAGKAYLQATGSSSAPSFSIELGDETTGIMETVRETTTNNQYYTLDGRRVAQPTKGLYIVNGKKVIIK